MHPGNASTASQTTRLAPLSVEPNWTAPLLRLLFVLLNALERRIEDAKRAEAEREGRDDGVGGDGIVGPMREGKDEEKMTVVTILCDSGMRHLSRFWADTEEVAGESGDDMTLEDVLRDD